VSDVNSNIGIHFDTADALASLRQLQAGLSKFNQALTEGNVAAANAQKGLNAQLMQSINATGKFVASQKTITSSTTSFTDALEKNKLSLSQYFRFTSAAATLNSKTLQNAFKQEKDILNRAMKDRVKSLQTQYIQLTNANGELVKVLQVVPKHLRMVNGQYTDYATRVQMAAQRQQMLNQLIKQGSTQLLNFGKNTQWAGRQLMVGLTIPLTMLGSVASKTFRDMEMATVKFTRVYGDMTTGVSDTNKAVAGIQTLAKEFTKFGIAATDTMNMAADAAAMGLTGAALQQQVTAATRLAVLGQVSQQDALQTTISLQNAFGISSDQLAQKINYLNAVENQTVLSIEDMTTAIPKAAPVVKQLGGTVEDLAFFLTAMKEGGINASEGANALKSGLASMINPTKKASDMLAGFGINIKGIVDANAGNIKGTVLGIARALDTLAPLDRARAIETMFGKFQFARISTLFQNITKEGSQASRAFNLAGASVEELAILSERELGKVENAVGVKFQKQLENLKLQLMPLGKAFLQAVTPVVQFASKMLEKFNNLSDGTKKFVVGFVAILGGIAPVALMTVGLVANGVANLIKFFGMLRGGMAKLNGQNNVLGGGFDYLTQAEIDNMTQSQALHLSHKDLIATFNVEATSVNLLADAYKNAASQARSLASGSPGLFNASPGAAGAVSGLPKFANGKVPGNESQGDSILALVAPGETIVPTDKSKKYGPLLQAIMGDKLPGFAKGKRSITSDQESFISQTARIGSSQPGVADEIAKQLEFINKASADKLIAYAKATGKTVSDSSEATLESLRKDLIADVKKVFTSVAETAKEKGKELTISAVKASTKKVGTAGSDSSLHEFYNPRAHQQQSTQFGHAETSNTYRADQLSQVVKFTDEKTKAEADAIINAINAHNTKTGDKVEMPKVTPVSGFGFDMKGEINKAMNDAAMQLKDGTDTIDAFMADFKDRGIEKWRKSVEIGGGNFEQLSSSLKVYDDKILEAVQNWKTANPGKPFTDTDFMKIEQSVRSQVLTVGDGLGAVFEEARNTVTAIRLKLTKQQREILNQDATARGEVPAGTAKYATDRTTYQMGGTERRTAQGHGKFADEVASDLDNAEAIAETASPSKRTERLGRNIGQGLSDGLSQSFSNVHSQSQKLAEAAIPSAAETQAKVSKMDLANKAFYDDLNTPELMDQRQILKSQDRQRRKLGATRTVDAAYPTSSIASTPQSSSISITNNQTTINAAQAAADKAMAEAAQAEEVAAKLRIEAVKWQETAAREGKKGTDTANNAEALKKQADEAEKRAAQARIRAAEAQAKAAAVSRNNGSNGSVESEAAKIEQEQKEAVKSVKASAKEAGKTREANKKTAKASEELATETQDSVNAQKKVTQQIEQKAKNGKKSGKASTAVLEAEKDSAKASEEVVDSKVQQKVASDQATLAQQDQTQSTITASELTDATAKNLAESANNTQDINTAEEQRITSAENIAKLENEIEEQKRKEKERGQAALAAEMSGPNIPDGSQTDKNIVNPDTAMSYEDAYKEASSYTKDKKGQLLLDPETGEPTTLTAKQIAKKRRGLRREKVGQVSGKISGGLGTAAMIAGMAGAPAPVVAGLGGAATLAQFAPMIAGLSGPQGVVAALAALAIGAKLLNDHFRKQAVEQARLVKEISATTDKMKKIGETTGKVGASEVMAKKRSNGLFNQYNVANRAGTKFGDTFLQSDIGKEISKSFVKNMEQTGAPEAAKNLALQLGTYISDGVLSAEQANSIAEQIGINLGSDTITANIQGNLRMIVGPNGEDILKDPIKVRMDIIQATADRSNRAIENMNKASNQRNTGIAGWFGNKTGRAEAAQLAAYEVNAVEIAQAQADAISEMYDKQKKALETEIAATTNKKKQVELQQKLTDLIAQSNSDNAKMQGQVGAQVDRAIANFQGNVQSKYQGSILNWGATDHAAARESAYFDSLKGQVKDVYANTDYKTMADTVLSRTAKISDNKQYGKQGFKNKEAAQTLEVRIDMLMANKQINPQQATTMLDLFDGNLSKLNTVLDVGVKLHGGAKVSQLMDYLSVGKKKGMMQEIITRVTKRAPADFDKFNKALASLAVLDGHEINMQVAVDTLGQPGLDKLASDLDAIDHIQTPITKEVIAKFIEQHPGMKGMDQAGMDELMSKWKDWDKLPDAVKKEAISKYQTIYETVFADEPARLKFMDEYAKKKANEASQNGKITQVYDFVYRTTYEGLQASGAEGVARSAGAEGAFTYLGEHPTIDSLNGNGDGTNSGNRDTTYDDLMKRLRNVRLAALDAAGGFKELQKAIAATGSKAIKDQFNGLEQQLIKMGQATQFSDYLAGLDTADLKKFGFTATKKGVQKYKQVDPLTGKMVSKTQKYKAGDFVLNQKGRDMEAGFTKAIAGDYNKEQLKSVTLQKQEIVARQKLVALGFNQADIQTMLADENYKILIATNKLTEAELKTNAALTAQARIRTKISSLYDKGQASMSVAENQQKIPQVVKFLQEAQMNAESIRTVLSDPDMLDQIITGMENFDNLAEDAKVKFMQALGYVDAIPDNKIIEIIYTQSEAQKMKNGADAAATLFDAYKTIDEHTIKNAQGNTYASIQTQMENLNNQAKIAQDQINLTQSKIDTMQLEVDKAQRDIETNFTRPIEQKQRAIDKLNRTAEINFVRPIQALQDRSNILSHDLEVMSHAADQINEKYDKQQEALTKVAEINQQIIQQQQQQLGLADALTQGDIAAAAKAAQDMRATSASNYATAAQDALTQARQNEINGLRGGVSGLSQKDIQEQQYQIGLQVYDLEQSKAAIDKQILGIQDEIYTLEQARLVAQDAIQLKTDEIAKIQFGDLLTQQNTLKAITDQNLKLQLQGDTLAKIIADNDANRIISGHTRQEWENIAIQADAAEKVASGDLARALAAAATTSGAIKGDWTDIKSLYDKIISKSVEITQYIKTIYGPMPGSSGNQTPADKAAADAKAAADKAAADKAAAQASAMTDIALADTSDKLQAAITNATAASLSISTIANSIVAPLQSMGMSLNDAISSARYTGQGLQFQAQQAAAAKEPQLVPGTGRYVGSTFVPAEYKSTGGLIPKYFAKGGYAIGTDTVPAMLTPGEFVMSRYAVNAHGVDTMKAMNSGAKPGDSVYNYNLNVSVKSDASPDDIAKTVIAQIKQIDSQRIRGNRF